MDERQRRPADRDESEVQKSAYDLPNFDGHPCRRPAPWRSQHSNGRRKDGESVPVRCILMGFVGFVMRERDDEQSLFSGARQV